MVIKQTNRNACSSWAGREAADGVPSHGGLGRDVDVGGDVADGVPSHGGLGRDVDVGGDVADGVPSDGGLGRDVDVGGDVAHLNGVDRGSAVHHDAY